MENKITPTLKNILFVALAVGLILLVPLAAMQFSDSFAWSPFDFATAGVLLFGTGLAFVLITRRSGSFPYLAAVGAALGTALFLLWSNLAVGILGSEDNPANWMYVGVLAVGLTGALIARFHPRGMQRALFATALAQAVVTAVALIFLKDLDVREVLLVNGLFIALWVGSAVLFWWADVTARR
jgi:hypothetical protein